MLRFLSLLPIYSDLYLNTPGNILVPLVLVGRIMKLLQVKLQTCLLLHLWPGRWSCPFSLFLLLPPFHVHSCFLAGVSSAQQSHRCFTCTECPPGGGLCWRRLLTAQCLLAGGVPSSKGREEALLSLHTEISNFLTSGAVALVLLHRLPAETNSLDYCVLSVREEHNKFPVLWKLLLLQLWFFQIGMTVYMKRINKYVFVLRNVFVLSIQHHRIDLISLLHYEHW